MRPLLLLGCALLATGCVSGRQLMADAEVISTDVERARRNGAMQCAPVDLAQAEAHLEFGQGELNQGNSGRAAEHIELASAAAKRALEASRNCASKQVVVEDGSGPVVVKVTPSDRDGDGILDDVDQCPDEPEDMDGFQDQDGCPDLDNDGDGVLDSEDRCPLAYGPAETQGCPAVDMPDADGDGIPDHLDKCPNAAEDMDGFEDDDGCPDPDNDGDGLLDSVDKCPDVAGPPTNYGCPIVDADGDGINDDVDQCPNEPEDMDGFEDEDGCPDIDNDNDGIPDTLDKCPNEAGIAELQGCPDKDSDGDGIPDRLDACPDQPGIEAEKGCPKQYATIVVKQDKIEIKQQINFRSGSASITGKGSAAVIDDVAQAMADNPQIRKLRIEGHTDSQGSASSNLKLSQRRAEAVMLALIKRKVDPARMIAIGYGEEQPIEDNSTAAGRAANRRTEFTIVE
ncbi:MAG TPA: OmpA family protein [Myxococcaceae bacterium]|nr:OmpA family protein [Myxococcaceae bacterium]